MTYGVQTTEIFLLFVHHKSWYSVVSLGRCSLFTSRVGLSTYQHPGRYWPIIKLAAVLDDSVVAVMLFCSAGFVFL